MKLFCARTVPLDLLPEPDPATAPLAQLDMLAAVESLAELGDWARVRRMQPNGAGGAGWVRRADLQPAESAAPQMLDVFMQPLGDDGAKHEARLLRTLVRLEMWRKVVLLRPDGSTLTGWIEMPEPAPAVPGPGAAPPPVPPQPDPDDALMLGANELFRDHILKAGRKTGIDPAALAAMIDAEAGTIGNGPQRGQWNAKALNESSGAAGLTQFLASTWKGHAAIDGTELNAEASRLGMIDGAGLPRPGREGDLLQLRFDPVLSIVSAAEYGAMNLRGLMRKGLVEKTASDDRKAWFMYLAHHEGLGGAMGFLHGGRSYSLGDLTIQVGAAKAAEFTAASAGDPNAAYRSWLKGYIDRKIQPSRFRRGGAAQPAVVGALAAGPENPEELRAYAD
ncbi:MAG: hypothetical protein ACRCTI_03405, partial [Beijerinckiaceae bacterium]